MKPFAGSLASDRPLRSLLYFLHCHHSRLQSQPLLHYLLIRALVYAHSSGFELIFFNFEVIIFTGPSDAQLHQSYSEQADEWRHSA